MDDFDDFTAKLKQTRDELKLQMHLASKEAEEEWEDLIKDWDRFVQKTQLDKSADEVGEAAKELGMKIKTVFDRLRKS
ncbi:hypothetical protein [Aquicoccus sp. SU-CL01552]|uniref:hypothetical protein n=1 Tax=Aquicoccus sp. SU-CL01552 TaxID=3127656 RepID=UPI0031069779